jgi:hypothetical protein
VDHLDEVAAAVGPAVEIPTLGGAADDLSAGRARNAAGAGGQGREDRVEVLHHRRLAADHEAVAALATPDSTASADVHVVDALRRELRRTPDVVDIVRVAAVDEDVAGGQQGHEVVDGRVNGRCRHHQPDGPRHLQLLHEVCDRRGADSLGPRQLLDRFR